MVDHSKNYRVESVAFQILRKHVPNLIAVDPEARRVIHPLLGLGSRARPFDAISLAVPTLQDVKSVNDFVLYEIKASGKKLENFPNQFFFGIFDTEVSLWNRLGHRFKVVLICTHPETEGIHFLENWDDTKINSIGLRTQYNLTMSLRI